MPVKSIRSLFAGKKKDVSGNTFRELGRDGRSNSSDTEILPVWPFGGSGVQEHFDHSIDGDNESTDPTADSQLPNLNYSGQENDNVVGVQVDQDFDEYTNEALGSIHNENRLSFASSSYERAEPVIRPVEIGDQEEIRFVSTDASVAGYEENSVIDFLEVDESVVFPDYCQSQDRLIDLLCWLPESNQSISRKELMLHVRGYRQCFNFPYSVLGLDIRTGNWSNVESGDSMGPFSDLIMTLQLNHNGNAVAEKDWWKFANVADEISRLLSREFFLSMSLESTLVESSLLAEKVREFSVQAALYLESTGVQHFSERAVQYLARQFHLQARTGGSEYVRFDTTANSTTPLFVMTPLNMANSEPSLGLDSESNRCTLMFCCDLACVNDPRQAFRTMVDVAKEMEDQYPLVLFNEERVIVDEKFIRYTCEEVDLFFQNMLNFGISPGQETALRLFTASDLSEDNQLEINSKKLSLFSLVR